MMNRNFVVLLGLMVALVGTSGCMVNRGLHVKDDKGNESKFDPNSQTMSFKGPDGSEMVMSPNAVTEERLTLPFYPGSEPLAFSTISKSYEGESVLSSRSTKDSVQQVMDFYRPKLTNPTESTRATAFGQGTALFSPQHNGAEVTVTAARDSENMTIISVQVVRRNAPSQN